MSKFFYAKLAGINIRKNARVYLPYLLTCIFTVAGYYMMNALSANPGIDEMQLGSASLKVCLGLGVWVISLFSVIFIFYTNSFLMKRRKKEIGLYNVLGMGKGHLSRMIFYETLYIAVISLVIGLGLGIVLDKASFLVLASLMETEVPLGFYISFDAIRSALILFGILFFLIFLNSLRQIHLTNPIELLRGGQMGEKEPKARWLLAVIGILLLGSGYWIAVTITNPVQAFLLFFVAVILVILGTYCLFTAGSIAILKLLRKNRRFYYQTNHFIAISGMIYRMKQNAVGLANICVLSTMVLVMVSSTCSMYFGMTDMIDTTFAREYEVRINSDFETIEDAVRPEIEKLLQEEGASPKNVVSYRYLNCDAQMINGTFEIAPDKLDRGIAVSEYYTITFTTLDDYNQTMGTQKVLDDGEILLYTGKSSFEGDVFHLGNTSWNIREKLSEFPPNGAAAIMMTSHLSIVVKDFETLRQLEKMQRWPGTDYSDYSNLQYSYAFDLDGSEEVKKAAGERLKWSYEALANAASEKGGAIYMQQVTLKSEERSMYLGLVGGLLFVGVFLGTLFIMATILIIYYKQISEGYDDKERFQIMEKVGMDKREIRKAIRSQVLTVFFLPLLMAGIHTAFAFPMIYRILQLLALQNTSLYLLCTGITYLIFAAIYGIIYSLTARTYYKIVR